MAADRDALQTRIRALFTVELEEAVRALNDGLLVLADAGADAGRRPELVRELFRVAHGIKGAAHSAVMPDAVAAATRLEDALSDLRDRPPSEWELDVDPLLRDVDLLAEVHASLVSAAPDSATPAAAAAPVARPPDPVAPAVRVATDHLERVVAASRNVQLLSAEVGALVEGLAEVTADHDEQRRRSRQASSLVRQLERLTADVGDAALELTLQPFGEACDGLARSLHDVTAARGKQARLTVTGGDVRVDRTVVAALREPLLHVVRNAADHGIETVDVRRVAGKPDEGSVRIEAAIDGGSLVVTVSDDGRGIDDQALAAAAAHAGITVDPDDDSPAFLAGITTASEVTALSGRGVGLDAVRSRIEAIGGSVRLDSVPGAGTTVTIRSPLTLTVMEVLVVESGGEQLCIPLAAVSRVIEVEREALDVVGARLVLRQESDGIFVASLAALAGFDQPAQLTGDRWTLVLLRGADRQVAARVEQVIGTAQVVVEPLPSRAANSDLLLGAAMLAEGVPAVVVNPTACIRRGVSGVTAPTAAPADGTRPLTVVVAEDTLTTRTLEVGILEAAGYHVLAAADGQEAWELLERHGADVVVSDVDMPRLDGIDLCRRIRASSRFSSLPIVLVTSLDSPDDRRRGVEAGADAYLVKTTFDQGTLLDAVARVR